MSMTSYDLEMIIFLFFDQLKLPVGIQKPSKCFLFVARNTLIVEILLSAPKEAKLLAKTGRSVAQLVERWTPGDGSPGPERFCARYLNS